MSTNRRLNLRKNKSNNKDGNQSISNFIERRSKDVEIVEDDDDVVQVTEEYDESVLRPLRRRKKKIAVVDEEEDEEDNDLELGGIEDMDEEEKQQIKEALRQSRLEMEKDKKRREIYKKFQNSKFNVESEMPTTSTADIPSSPISSSIEPSGMERAESPDLFGPTPQSNIEKDEKVDAASSESSSSKNDFKSFPLQKEISIQLSPVQRPSTKKNQSSANIDSCQETAPHNEQPTKSKSPPSSVTSKEKGRISKSLDSKKRKHSIEDDSDDDGYDGAKENMKEPPKVETRKRQKTIQDNFSVLTPKKQNKEANKQKETNLFVINDDDVQDENRNTTTLKYKKSSKVTLKRKYKKNRPPIKTIRDAMKARLFFAPPGINQKLYTLAIMRMLDHSKECIRKAQQRSLQFAKWGEPIVVGPREVDSLDAKKDKRKSNHINKESLHGPPELRTKRNLRSTQSKVSEPTKTETNSNKDIKSEIKYSTEMKVKTEKFDFVTSDDSDEELTKSVFGHKEKNPKSWTEYNSRTDSFKFGENVNTSATRVVKDVEQNDKNILDNNMEKKDVESHVGLKQKCDNNNDSGVKIDKETTSKFDNEDKLSFQNSNSPTAADMYFADNITTVTSSEAKINNDTCNITRKSHNIDKEEHNVRTDIDDNSSKLTSNNENVSTKSVKEQCNSETNDSDDGIDSSAEIGKLKVKRSSKRKSAVIEDIEEEADEKTFGTATRVDVEMIDVDDIITPTGSNNTKPGESLTSSASKSGFLKASRSEIKPPAVQRKITPTAQKAAEAAEKRMRQEKIGEPSGSGINLSKNDSFSKENVVQCPICYSDFPFQDIEAHAEMCNGTPPDLDQTGKEDRRGMAVEHVQNSPSLQQSQEYGLKDLKVVVTRSPEAQRRLVDKLGNHSNLKAKRNLSLMKKEKVDTKKVVADVVDMTSDDDDDSPKEMNDGSPNKDETEVASKSNLDEWPTERF